MLHKHKRARLLLFEYFLHSLEKQRKIELMRVRWQTEKPPTARQVFTHLAELLRKGMFW